MCSSQKYLSEMGSLTGKKRVCSGGGASSSAPYEGPKRFRDALDSTMGRVSCSDSEEFDGLEAALLPGFSTELLADSFLKALFTRFYHMLQSHGPIAHKGLQV